MSLEVRYVCEPTSLRLGRSQYLPFLREPLDKYAYAEIVTLPVLGFVFLLGLSERKVVSGVIHGGRT